MKIEQVFQNILSLEKEISLTEKEIVLLKLKKGEELKALKEKRGVWVATANRKIKAALKHNGRNWALKCLDGLNGQTERVLELLDEDIQKDIRAG